LFRVDAKYVYVSQLRAKLGLSLVERDPPGFNGAGETLLALLPFHLRVPYPFPR